MKMKTKKMEVETRPLTAADAEAYSEVGAYAYNSTREREGRYLEDVRRHPSFGVFADGRLAAALVGRRFDVSVHGRPVKADGIGMVASAPETRRLGLVRELLRAYLEQLREQGVVLSLLYPFDFQFYARMGWAFAARGLEIRVAPGELATFGRRTGNVRRVLYAEKDLQRVADGETVGGIAAKLDAVYRQATSDSNLSAVRKVEDWREMFTARRGLRHVAVWEGPSKRVEGYVVYTVRVAGEWGIPADLDVREMFAVSPEAWRGLCGFLATHDSHIRHVIIRLLPEHPLLELVRNPRVENGKLVPGAMARAVDVAGLLGARGTPDSGPGECTVAVSDPLAPWNDGSFLLRSDGGELAVQPVEVPPAGTDIRADVNGFTQLAIGYRGVDEMLLFGIIAGNPGPRLDFARRLFPVRPTMHLEYY